MVFAEENGGAEAAVAGTMNDSYQGTA